MGKSTKKIEEDGIIMEFDCNNDRETEKTQIALFMYINGCNDTLEKGTEINVEADMEELKVRVIANKGGNVIRATVLRGMSLIETMKEDGTF